MLKAILLASILNIQVEADTVPLIDSNIILEQIQTLNENQEYTKSIELLESVSEYDSNYVAIQTALISTYSKNNELSKAQRIGQTLSERKDLTSNYYITFGNIHANNGLINEGMEIYQAGLKSFPYNTSLLYNLGYAEYTRENYEEAIPYLKQTLTINPYFSATHQILGNIMSLTKQKTKAILSYLTYLAISPDQKWALIRLNELVMDAYRAEGSIKLPIDNSAFEYYDNLVRSKAALDDRFKSSIDLEVAIAQQAELLISKLKYEEGTDDFWMEFYVPYLEGISKAGLTEAFVYFMLFSSENEVVLNWLKKNEKEKRKWISITQNHLDKYKISHKRTICDSTDMYKHWFYDDGSLQAIGNGDIDINIGPYEFYHPNGRLKAKGLYNAAGKKEGVWYFFHDNGQLKSKQSYADDILEGSVITYDESGQISSKSDYTDGLLNGYWQWYYPCGNINEQYPFKNGSGTGDGKVFYETGEVRITYSVVEDKNNGEYKVFYKSGQLANKYVYDNDMLSGNSESYHPNGVLSSTGKYQEDKQSGEWENYSINGELVSKGSYLNGEKIGEWEYYHPNGNKMRSEKYNDSGKLDGLTMWYDIDGKLHSERDYSDGMLTAYKYWDKSGILLVDEQNEDGNMPYTAYYASGDLYSKGNLKNGLIEGEYTIFHYNGNKYYEGSMKGDNWQGELREYYNSGELKIVSNHNNGSLNGYYRSYFKNGNIEEEGWLKDGNIQQRWLTYFINGSVKSDGYYTNGELNEIKYYDAKERVFSIEYFKNEILQRIDQYDTLGNIYNVARLSMNEDTLLLKNIRGEVNYKKYLNCGNEVKEIVGYTEGKAEYRYILKNSEYDKYISYRHNGKVDHEGSYLNGKRQGKWNIYYDNQNLEYTSSYIAGNKEGKSIAYYSNGQKESDCSYYQDEKNGPCHYYEPSGELQLIKHYLPKYGIHSYQYMLPNGQLSDTIVVDKSSSFTIKSYFQNGKVSVIQPYKKGYYHGAIIYYDPEGNIVSKSEYEDGLSHGLDVEYYSNGKHKREANFYYDKNHGKEKFYHENGQLKKVINWYYGSKEGWSRSYDANGKILTEVFYRNGNEY